MARLTRPGDRDTNAARLCCAFAMAVTLTGCGPKNFDNDNDALRRRVTELEGERDAAMARAVEAEAKLSEAVLAKETLLEGQALEALPRCAGVTIDRFSGLEDRDGDGMNDTVVVYVKPFDGRQRFVQVPGKLTAEATILAPAPEAAPAPKGKKKAEAQPAAAPAPPPEPRVLGPVTLSPVQLREAYRSSLLGTHYVMELPAGGGVAPGSSVVLRVSLLDPSTGIEHKAERLVSGR